MQCSGKVCGMHLLEILTEERAIPKEKKKNVLGVGVMGVWRPRDVKFPYENGKNSLTPNT